ncbi:MAG: YraN family protein [Myxococcales bacterium]|nr:YraN family protein [Myxococcales bacterium]
MREWIRRLLTGSTGETAAADGRGQRGRQAEELACRHIRRRGGRVAARNWRCPAGEVDLIVVDRQALAFVEVKSRAATEFGRPAEAVHRRKRRKLEQLALLYCRQQKIDPPEIRFDIFEVVWSEPPAVEWTRGAWLAGE